MPSDNKLEKVKKLRERTGVGFKDCKNALDETKGDIEKSVELLRIRILESSEEPIITTEGEIDLEAGDVHQLEQQIADYLIQAGVAEAAPL